MFTQTNTLYLYTSLHCYNKIKLNDYIIFTVHFHQGIELTLHWHFATDVKGSYIKMIHLKIFAWRIIDSSAHLLELLHRKCLVAF